MDRMNRDKIKSSLRSFLPCPSCSSLLNISLFCLLIFSVFTFSANAQEDLPDNIRGYKVQRTDIVIGSKSSESSEDDDLRVETVFDEPELTGVGLTGITLALGGEFTIFGQSGTVDFISFQDFKVNGINVDVEEYKESFDFKKNEPYKLKKPVEIFVGTLQAMRGASKEYNKSADKWKVTGKVFVFGKFNKLGFKFKRVILKITVEVDMTIENPLKSAAK